MVKGMNLIDLIPDQDKDLRLCDPCERGKPLRHVRKQTEKRNLKIFDKVHINMVMITPQGIRKKRYATIFIEKASLAC
jgi:hypothetical protein